MRLLLLFLVASVPTATVVAEDLQSTDGTVYRRAKVVQVDPDGLIVKYDKGVAKIDFQRLPAEMQRRFGYREDKARVYRTQEIHVVQENQRIVKEHEEQELERIRKLMESGASGDELIFRGNPGRGTAARMARAIESEMYAREEATVAKARTPRTFWNASFWQAPVAKFLGAVFGGGGGSGVINNGADFDNHRGFTSP